MSKSSRRKQILPRPAPANAALTPMQKRQVKSMIDSVTEEKAWYFTSGTVNVTTAGTCTKISSVGQGVADNDRNGDVLRKKMISFMYTITVGAAGLIAAADIFNTVRVIIFEWLNDDYATVPTPQNVIENSAVTVKTIALQNWDTKHLYKVLYDRSHVVFNSPIWNGAAVTWQHGVGGTFQTAVPVNIPLKSKVEFDANGQTGKGHLYVLLISDSAFTPNPTIEFSSRLLFEDA